MKPTQPSKKPDGASAGKSNQTNRGKRSAIRRLAIRKITMSAYIVEKNHILYLVEAAMSRRISPMGGAFSWYHGNPQQRGELTSTNYAKAAEVANMLWLENIASVSYRYPNETSATLPGPNDKADFVIKMRDFSGTCFPEFDPAQILKACHCFAYQSCEHDGWKDSEAYAFIQSLEGSASRAVAGYEEAIWGAPEAQTGVVNLTAMMMMQRKAKA